MFRFLNIANNTTPATTSTPKTAAMIMGKTLSLLASVMSLLTVFAVICVSELSFSPDKELSELLSLISAVLSPSGDRTGSSLISLYVFSEAGRSEIVASDRVVLYSLADALVVSAVLLVAGASGITGVSCSAGFCVTVGVSPTAVVVSA